VDNPIGSTVHYQGVERCYAAIVSTRYHRGVVDLWLIPTREYPHGKLLENVPYSNAKQYGCWHEADQIALCKFIEIL